MTTTLIFHLKISYSVAIFKTNRNFLETKFPNFIDVYNLEGLAALVKH